MIQVQRCQPWLGTYVQILARAKDHEMGQRACAAAFKRIAAIHTLMSFHDPQSEISRINKEAYDRPVQVSTDTWTVLRHALRISTASDGLFDITVVPVLQQWGYLPLMERSEPFRSDSNFRDIELAPNRRVKFRKPLQIDLGGIAKGFAVDRAVEILKKNGVEEGSVNAGGDLRIFGGNDQVIRVRHPMCSRRLIEVAKIKEGAIATSADYYSVRFVERERVNPIVNPITKSPSPAYQSVSVMASSCMTADALTKVVTLMGDRSGAVLKKFHAKAVILNPQRGKVLSYEGCHV